MSEIFSQEFIEELPEDNVLACAAICEAILSFNRQRLEDTGHFIEDQNAYLDAVAFFQVYTDIHPLDVFYELPELGTDSEENSKIIVTFFEKLNAELNKLVVKQKLSDSRQAYAVMFGQTISYQFKESEREQIVKLIHELRVLIDDWDKLEADHQARLLNRLGKIHGTLDDKRTELDVIWGLLSEARIVKAKYGHSARLIVDRLHQIVDIAWRAQARAENIDADSDKLTVTFP